jgi:hypothetical protein
MKLDNRENNICILQYFNQGFGSGSAWIWIQKDSNDPQKKKKEKRKEITCFKVLAVLLSATGSKLKQNTVNVVHVNVEKLNTVPHQSCGSEMFISDTGSESFPSRIQGQQNFRIPELDPHPHQRI